MKNKRPVPVVCWSLPERARNAPLPWRATPSYLRGLTPHRAAEKGANALLVVEHGRIVAFRTKEDSRG